MGHDARPPAARPGRHLLLVALWAGLAGGLGEFCVVMIRKYWFHRYIFEGSDVAWMAPLSLAILCGIVAIPLMLFGRSRFAARVSRLPYAVLAFLALVDAIPAIPNVHWIARLLMLMGIAWQLGAWAARHTDRLERAARRTALPLLVLVALLALGFQWRARIRERRALAALPAAPAAAPNILLLILDTVRAMDLSLYGYERATTPVLEQLGKRGVVFERAYAPSSWTLATHASIFTGHLPFETGVSLARPLDGRLPTLAEALGARGYVTAGFVANLTYVSRESGLARGFAHYEDYPVTILSVLLGSAVARSLVSSEVRAEVKAAQIPGRKRAEDLRHDVLAWLERRPTGRPFFAFINYWDAHAPYVPPAPFDTAFTGTRLRWKDRNPFLLYSAPVTSRQASPERDAYDQVIASLDHEIGALLAALEQRDLLRNTLILVTSDHGEEFGEHGLLDHGTSLNPAVLWVPLLLVFPARLPAGVRVSEPVSLVHLAATALTLADTTRAPELPGSTLVGSGAQAAAPQSPVLAELEHTPGLPAWFPTSRGPLSSVTSVGWHYVRDAQGVETLMDIRSTPAGLSLAPNLPGLQDFVRGSRAVLDSVARRTPNP